MQPKKSNNRTTTTNQRASYLRYPTTNSKSGDTINIRGANRNERSSSSDDSINLSAAGTQEVKITKTTPNSNNSGSQISIGLYLRAFSLNRKNQDISKMIGNNDETPVVKTA